MLFTSDRTGNNNIFRLDLNNPSAINLTNSTAVDEAPNRSPDSRWVAFASNRSGHYNIYVITADGKTLLQLTTTSDGDDRYPAWGAQGQIAFERTTSGGRTRIYLIDLKTRTERPVTTDQTAASAEQVHPAWSFDGRTLAYETRAEGGKWNISLLNVARGTTVPLTQNNGNNTGLSWSPVSNNQLAFLSDRDGQPDLYVSSPDGKTVKRLTNDASAERDVAWSPDGTRIAFASDGSGTSQIYVVNISTGKITQITNASAASISPTWSCNSAQIVYSAADGGANSPYHLYQIASSGTGTPKPLTSGPQSDTGPVVGQGGTNSSRND